MELVGGRGGSKEGSVEFIRGSDGSMMSSKFSTTSAGGYELMRGCCAPTNGSDGIRDSRGDDNDELYDS